MDGRPGEDLTEVGGDLSSLVGLLVSPSGQGLDLDRLVLIASRTMPVEASCGITLVRKDRALRTLVATDETSRTVDALQLELDQGPSLDAAAGEKVAPADDLLTEQRWPVFGPRCVEETGVRSILAVQLPLASGDVAALTLTSRHPSAFDDLATGLAALYAPIAALGVEQSLRAEDADQMSTALSSSRQIGTAIGIIMERRLVTAEEAMEVLRRSSQHLNRKLRDIALEVAETGQMPVEPGEQPGR